MTLSKHPILSRLFLGFLVGLFFINAQNAEATIETSYVSGDAVLSLNEPAKTKACTMYGDIGSWASYGGHAYRYIAKNDLSKITANPAQILKATFNIDR